MTKLFKYELRRLLLNKFFIGLLAISCLYGWQLLSGSVIWGTADTAPFSGWSYGSFITGLLPILLITLLFFITFLYSKNENMVAVLVRATPTKPSAYVAMRMSAIVCGFALICAAVIVISLVFYAGTFRFTDFSAFALPALLVLLPAALLTLGLGMHAGQTHPWLIYVLMVAMLFIGRIPLPYSIDVLGGSFFYIIPYSLRTDVLTEPGFAVPPEVWAGRAIIAVVGVVLVVTALRRGRRAGAR